MAPQLSRLARALQHVGLNVSYEESTYTFKSSQGTHPDFEVLLPDTLALERKALLQFQQLVQAQHPLGGRVHAAVATPDFHPGQDVPIGSVIATSPEMVIPQAIGGDIHCGMRLHTLGIDLDTFEAHRIPLLERLRNVLLLGKRDLPMQVPALRALFREGLLGWHEVVSAQPLGQLQRTSMAQVLDELECVYQLGSLPGDEACVPDDLLPHHRDVVRDGFLATLGGGNHFLELQVVDTILDTSQAYAWGLRQGQLMLMIHTGSRRVGAHIGDIWSQRARARWPRGLAQPASDIFPLIGADAAAFVREAAAAANYASLNRLLLAELVRDALRSCIGQTLEAPLIFDAPHNMVAFENNRWVHRKGATPAHEGQPVLIPGSMGQASYVMAGCGADRFLSSASHGAGRAKPRHEMLRLAKQGHDLGLAGVTCVTLRDERRWVEAPAAYKDIDEVIDVQVEAGLVKPVAKMRPLVTFKG